MIIHSFDTRTQPIISPASMYGEQKRLCDVCIVTFSKVIHQNVLDNFACAQIGEIGACNGVVPIYSFEHGGHTFAFYLSGIGSTIAATDVIEANWLVGATTFVMFGSAGCLNREVTAGKYVVPTAAYRDEGMSYHYAAPADYIDVPGADRVAEILEEMNAPYVKGRVWTTDAFYRETRGLMEQRRSGGCLAVEMELAGVQAVCHFHGFKLYNFLMTGDILDAPEYSVAELSVANHNLDNFALALHIARRVADEG